MRPGQDWASAQQARHSRAAAAGIRDPAEQGREQNRHHWEPHRAVSSEPALDM